MADILSYMPEHVKMKHPFQVANTYLNHGYGNSAVEFLARAGFHEDSIRLGQTLVQLANTDPNWHTKARIIVTPGHLQIDYGGFGQRQPFSASIVNGRPIPGGEHFVYEILPVFEGKRLNELGDNDEVLPLPLERAVALANATLSRDLGTFNSTRQRLYQ